MERENRTESVITKDLQISWKFEVSSRFKAVEVERSGNITVIQELVERLKESGKPQKVFIVPSRSMNQAKNILKKEGVSATISNISGTKREYVYLVGNSR
jgi:hypothetical protein